MLDDITNAFVHSIDNSAWIDKKTKSAIKEKAMAVKREIGFPEWILDKNEVEMYYGDVCTLMINLLFYTDFNNCQCSKL